jgi:hypothetical protein
VGHPALVGHISSPDFPKNLGCVSKETRRGGGSTKIPWVPSGQRAEGGGAPNPRAPPCVGCLGCLGCSGRGGWGRPPSVAPWGAEGRPWGLTTWDPGNNMPPDCISFELQLGFLRFSREFLNVTRPGSSTRVLHGRLCVPAFPGLRGGIYIQVARMPRLIQKEFIRRFESGSGKYV